MAAWGGHPEVVEVLLKWGASVNAEVESSDGIKWVSLSGCAMLPHSYICLTPCYETCAHALV